MFSEKQLEFENDFELSNSEKQLTIIQYSCQTIFSDGSSYRVTKILHGL